MARGDIWSVTIAQIAPIMPYLLLVLILSSARWACLGPAIHTEIASSAAPLTGRRPRSSNSLDLDRRCDRACGCCLNSSLRRLADHLQPAIGISIIFSLSCNILLGQTGMLSFDTWSITASRLPVIHAINLIGANKSTIPCRSLP